MARGSALNDAVNFLVDLGAEWQSISETSFRPRKEKITEILLPASSAANGRDNQLQSAQQV